MAIRLTRISVFGVYFTGLTSIFSGYLRLHGDFIIPALIGFPLNLVIIVTLFLSSKTSIYVLGAGSVVATASRVLICIPSMRKVGYRHSLSLNARNDHLKTMMLLALPVIVGTAVNDINVLVDRTMASRISVGAISALNYARHGSMLQFRT
jgi:putative peptidoglycan lipid II flippase